MREHHQETLSPLDLAGQDLDLTMISEEVGQKGLANKSILAIFLTQ